MSTGQIVGGVIGAIASFFVPGASTLVYASIGSALGGALMPTKGPVINGPRLDDLSLQTSTYGAIIPRVYGTVSLNGNVFWLENNQLKETVKKKKSGGKGGGGTTTREYSYSATFAVGLCKGPIVGVRRIWVGPDLIYDAGSADSTTIAASNEAAAGFEVYLGTDTQNADPRMQATLGVANTPAWRGLAYIVFYDLQLAKYANSLAGAQIKVEVIQTGITYTYPYTSFTEPNYYWRRPAWDGTVFCTVAYFNHVVATSTDGLTWATYSIPNGNSAAYQGCASDGAGTLLAYGTSATNMWRSTNHGQNWTNHTLPGFSGYVTRVEWNGSGFLAITDSGPFFTSTNGITWTSQSHGLGTGDFSSSLCWHSGSSKWYVRPTFGTGRNIYSSPSGVGASWTLCYTMPSDFNNHNFCAVHNGRILYCGYGTVSSYGPCVVYSDDGVTWNYAASPLYPYYVLSDGQNAWLGDANGRMYYSADGVTGWTHWVGPLQAVNHEAVYGNSFIVCLGQGGVNGYRIAKTFSSSVPATLSSIVSTECQLSGLIGPSDIDVTGLASSSVRGYRIGSVGAIRSALDPLRGAWFFDLVQHGYKIQFKVRGSASVVTIPGSDLDARGAGEDSGISITTAREMVSQLPNKVSVKFLDYDREYDDGEQYARREASTFVKLEVVELPIVMTATEAVGKAETLLYLRWLERYDVSFNLPPTYAQLEPGDVIDVTTPEGNIPLRLVAVNTTAEGRVECKAKYSSAAIYTPTSVGYTPVVTGPTTVARVGASVYQLMDLPLLSTAQSGPSFLAAMTGALTGWAGGVLMQSTDAGSTWVSLQDFGPPGATMGTCSNSLSTVESRMIDSASALTVVLSQGALYSVTELAMLGGANYFAYGADGRWEIIAAKTCTLVSGTTYTLTNLLRGRYGTEWAMGLHVGGDTLVLLDTVDTSVIASSSGAIGLSYLYRGITLDRDISTDSNKSFTYQGVNLKPLSPVYLNGSIDPSTSDWSLSWVRRTRDGGEWRDSVDASLGETVESYQVDIYSSGSYTTLKRTLSCSTSSVAYTSADQVTDFGSNQATLYLKVYQISSVVGRGYPLTTTITG